MDAELPPKARNFLGNLQQIRTTKGISQTQFAKELHSRGLPFHQPTVQRVEDGSRPIRLAEAEVMADVLGVTLEEMFVSKTPRSARTVLKFRRGDAVRALGKATGDLNGVEFDIAVAVASLQDAVDTYERVAEAAGEPPEAHELARSRALLVDIEAVKDAIIEATGEASARKRKVEGEYGEE